MLHSAYDIIIQRLIFLKEYVTKISVATQDILLNAPPITTIIISEHPLGMTKKSFNIIVDKKYFLFRSA